MRRFWMLLLAIVALAALLAVPAMAAELPALDSIEAREVTDAVGTAVYTRPADMSDADWLAYEVLVRGESPKLTCPEDKQLTFEKDGIYVRSGSEVRHCYCGWVSGKHDAGCNQYDVLWTAWTSGALNASKNYYLTKDTVLTNKIKVGKTSGYQVKDKDMTPTLNIVFDLNGHDLSSEAAGCRVFQVWPDANFMLCNSKAEGGVVTGNGDDATNPGTNYGVMQIIGYKNTVSMMRGVTLQFDDSRDVVGTEGVVGTESVFNMYGGTIIGDTDAHTKVIDHAGAVGVYGGTATDKNDASYKVTYQGVFNMYEGAVITGGAATYGGAVYVKGGVMNCYGGTINGGVSTSGAAVYVLSNGVVGTFNAKKGASGKVATINGGTATEGGAIYLNSGSVTLDEGTIVSGGTASTNGGTVYVKAGTLNIKNSTVTGGTATSAGGALYMANGTVTLEGATLNGGTVSNATKDAGFGGAVHVAGGSFTAKSKSVIDGGQAPFGGAVYMAGGTVTLNDSTVKNGIADRTPDTTATSKDGWGGRGAGFFVAGGTLKILNGSKVELCRVDQYDSRSDSTPYGGSCIFATGGQIAVENSTLDGYRKALTMKRGGTVWIDGATMTLTSATVNATYVGCDTAAIMLIKGSVTMTDSVVDASVLSQCIKNDTNLQNITYAGAVQVKNGTFTMKSGQIKGFKIAYNNGGGTVYMNDAKGKFVMESGTISGGDASGYTGGNVRIASGTFTMKGGTISGGKAKYGGNVYLIGTNSKFQLQGGTVEGGEAVKGNGGNFHVAADATVELSGGLIKNGKASRDENQHGNGSNLVVYGTLTMTGGEILQESTNLTNCKGAGHNVYANDKGATLNLLGGKINGYVYICDFSTTYYYPTLTLGGNIRICNDVAGNASVYMYWRKAGTKTVDGVDTQFPDTYPLFTLKNLTADAKVGISSNDPVTGQLITAPITDGSVVDGIYSDNADYMLQKNSDNALELVEKANANGVTINGGGVVIPFNEAVESLGEKDYITLISDRSNDTINKSIMLDLNGFDLTNVTLAEGVELRLFDAATVDYAVEADKASSNGFSGYGIVTLSKENNGTIARQYNTPKATYGGNYRFVVIKDAEGYHAHRIYLSVKSTILYPNRVAVDYRTALRCDQVIAKYINAEGGGFGIFTTTKDGKVYGDYTENGIAAKCWDAAAEEENLLVTRLSNILDPDETDAVNSKRAATSVKAQAYIFLADSFDSDKLTEDKDANAELIAQKGITSSGVNASLQGMVAAAFAKDPATLAANTKDALYNMYTQWSGVMSAWDGSLKYLQSYKDDYQGVDLKYACLCGDPNNERGIVTPCSVAGHPKLTWREWDVSKGTLPGTTGNYYLSGDLNLTSQGSVAEGQIVNLNLNGHNIVSHNNCRVSNVYGVFNLTNFTYDGTAVSGGTLTAYGAPYRDKVDKSGTVTGHEGGNGGNLLIAATGNVSLYSNVTLQMAENHNAKNGVVELNGDLNVYGGRVSGAEMKNTYINNAGEEKAVTDYGGAISINSNGYFYMNAGTITGGKASYGGTIRSEGIIELEGGTITAGRAIEGAMFYIKAGELRNRGISLDATDGLAERGGVAYVNGGKISMSGTAESNLTLTGGATYAVVDYQKTEDGKIQLDANNKPVKFLDDKGNQTDRTVASAGSGGVFFVQTGILDLEYCTLNGSVVKELAADPSDKTKYMNEPGAYSDDLDNHGGSVMFVRGGTVTMDSCELNGYTKSKINKRGGVIYQTGGTITFDGDAAITKGSTLNAGWSGVNSAVLYQTGGTFTMNKGTVLDGDAAFNQKTGVVKDGLIYGGVVSLAGSEAVFNMNGGEIKNGVAKYSTTHGGGNVNMSGGTFNMRGGEIKNGWFKKGTPSVEHGGANVRVAGGTFNMTGGTITGGIDETGRGGGILQAGSKSVLKISGNARITSNYGDVNKTVANNVFLESGRKITLGKLESGAKVSVTLADVGGTFTTENTENTQAVLVNGWLCADFNSENSEDMGLDSDNQFYLGKYSCVCGNMNGEHLGSCTTEAQFWMPWTDTNNLPDQAGYWYLAYAGDEVTVKEQANIGTDATDAVHVVLDLNGKTVYRAEGQYNNRFYAINGAADHLYTLTITDNSVGRKGKLVCANEGTGQGLGVWMNSPGSILNILAGTIDASGKTATKYGGMGVCQEKNTHVNMYGGAILGGNTDKGGGAVYMSSNATFTMHNGTLVGGTVKGDGGTVYMAANASFTMNGGTILAGSALCKQAEGSAKTKTVTIDGKSYTVNYKEYIVANNDDHGEGGAVYIMSGASFTMNDGNIQSAEDLGQRNAGYGGMICVEGTFNMHGGTVSGGSVDGRNAPAYGVGTEVNHDCGYGGNIFISGGTMNMYGGTVSDGVTRAAYLPEGTYTKDGQTLTIAEYGGAGGGLGGNIAVSGKLNIQGGTVEGGIAETGGNIATNQENAEITIGAPADAAAPINEKTVQILGGEAIGSGGNLAINVRPCRSFVINEGTWIEGGHAGSAGGNISITPWVVNNGQYVQTGTDANGKTTYETEYAATIDINGGTVTGGTTESIGGNIYLYGRDYTNTNTNTNYPKVYIYATVNVGDKALITDGAATNNGNNVYLNPYSELQLSGTVRNTYSKGDQITVGEETVTVSLSNVMAADTTSRLQIEATGAIRNEKGSGAQTQPVMRNLHTSGAVTMNGGIITGGYTTGASDHGGNIYMGSGTFTMKGGTVTGGTVSGYTLYAQSHDKAGQMSGAAHGGNIYVYRGSFTMEGGSVVGGICTLAKDTSDSTNDRDSQVSGSGGNIYNAAGGTVTIKGTALVEGGKVARSGGNIYTIGTLRMEGEAQVRNGLSTLNNGGNIFVNSSGNFTLESGTISGGRTRDGGGNVYANGTFTMNGGLIENGQAGLKWTDWTKTYTTEPTAEGYNSGSANVFLVGGVTFRMTGGEIVTGVAVTNSVASPKTIVLSGTAKIGGSGMSLTDYGSGAGKLHELDVSGLQAGAEVRITVKNTKLATTNTNGHKKLIAANTSTAYTQQLVKAGDPHESQVAYLTAENAPNGEAGIYLVNTSQYRYSCLCGANFGEQHLLKDDGYQCDGTQVLWKPWTQAKLPDEPGNWFLTGLTTKTGTDGEKYVKISTSAMKYDYYMDADGNYVKVRALLERNEEGAVISLPNGNFQQLQADGKAVWLNGGGTAIAQIPEGTEILDSYGIRVDLNGYRLEHEGYDRNLTFYGRGTFNSGTASYKALMDGELKNYPNSVGVDENGLDQYCTHRQAKVSYTIIDSSEGHTAELSTYGRYSGQQRNTKNSPQGANIWLYWKEDTLNTYRITIDSSNVKLGWGLGITTHGTVNLYATTVIGGVAQGYFGTNQKVEAGDGTSGYVKKVSGSVIGGGAICIEENATVNMFGGTIRDGITVYRNMAGSNGVATERSVGGGNVFVSGVFNVTGTDAYPAVITGGKALNYVGDTDNTLSSYSYAQGGGVYINTGEMTVSGNVTIDGNNTGTVNGTEMNEDGSGLGIVELDRASIALGAESNLFLNGHVLEVKNLTGTVGYSMIGTDWQGNFAKVDNGSTAYVDSGKLVADTAQSNTRIVFAEDAEGNGYLRYVAQGGKTLQVGYGVASIHPTTQDIANGLALGGYGNNSYSTSEEEARITRYWANPTSTLCATDPNHTLNGTTAPMQAVAMAFRDTEGDTVIIVNLDYNNVSTDVGTRVKQLIALKTGVSVDNITVAASHQHTGPSISKTYWADMEGNPTQSYEEAHGGATLMPGTTASGTYGEIIYGNPLLKPWEPQRLRTDYYTTFYTGVVNAAVAAYQDLAPVTSITAGIMDTTSGGNQFNFVRNVALYDSSTNTLKGMTTDNHTTHQLINGTYYSTTKLQNGKIVGVNDGNQILKGNLVQKPESELDVTMQLVRYERANDVLVLSNFQSHPHLADGSDNLNPTGGVVYIFRDQLSQLYSTEEKPCKVLYFSGAGGNVNSSYKISADAKLQPWYDGTTDTTAKDENGKDRTEPAKRALRAKSHGTTLATLADNFLTTGNMSIAVDPAEANVQVSVQDFEYTVWNEQQNYTVGDYTIPATWSEYKKQQAALLIDWDAGGYLDRPGKFNTTYKREGSSIAYWYEFAGNPSNKNDKIYSLFHANGVRKRYLRNLEGAQNTGHFEIKAYDLGGIGFVAAPYEMFQESGQAIKGNVQATLQASNPTKYANFPNYVTNGCGYIVNKSQTGQTQSVSSPYPITIIASQATGAQGYIPSVIGYVNGGYATDTTLFAPGTGEQLVTAYVDLLIGLNSANATTTAEGE